MTAVSVVCFVLLLAGIVLVFGITPKTVTENFMRAVRPEKTLKQRIIDSRSPAKKRGIAGEITRLKHSFQNSGDISRFYTAVTVSVCLALTVCLLLILLENPLMIPVGMLAAGAVPFLVLKKRADAADKRARDELETAMSVITTSYLRTDDIVSAVEENLRYLKPPVKNMFAAFAAENAYLSADVTGAIRNLAARSDNRIFGEWCETLVKCRDDRSLKDTLPGIAAKLSDERMVNEELKTTLSEIKKEYVTMVFMVIGNIPLLWFLNKDWFNALLFSLPGKITLCICAAVILVTALLLGKYTKPLEYGGKET